MGSPSLSLSFSISHSLSLFNSLSFSLSHTHFRYKVIDIAEWISLSKNEKHHTNYKKCKCQQGPINPVTAAKFPKHHVAVMSWHPPSLSPSFSRHLVNLLTSRIPTPSPLSLPLSRHDHRWVVTLGAIVRSCPHPLVSPSTQNNTNQLAYCVPPVMSYQLISWRQQFIHRSNIRG